MKRHRATPVYKGKTENGYHRYSVERPIPRFQRKRESNGTISYTEVVHEWFIDRSRILAWALAWWSWAMTRTIGDEL